MSEPDPAGLHCKLEQPGVAVESQRRPLIDEPQRGLVVPEQELVVNDPVRSPEDDLESARSLEGGGHDRDRLR
jgi:hypothetical protein